MKLIVGFVLGLLCTVALAQTVDFQPGNNPVVNQARKGVAVTYSDTVNIAVTRGLYNGNATACDIAVLFNGDTTNTITLKNVPSGATLPYQIVRVKNSATTCSASTIIALY
jgi:hypothetical protein